MVLFDMYRKVPDELQESWRGGSVMSICCLALMGWITLVEVGAYLRTEVRSKVGLDDSKGAALRINFNLSFPHLHCDHASVDLWDKIGRNSVNVTQNIEKWQLDSEGRRRMYQGRNRKQLDVQHDTHHPPLEHLHADGVHVDHVGDDWDEYSKAREFVFAEFHAPWCGFCQRLAPTWEALAEELVRRESGVQVAAVNCVDWPAVCQAQTVRAFPTLRFFHRGEQVNEGEYRFDRTVAALAAWAERKVEAESVYKQYPEARVAHRANWNADHPGCLVTGFLLVNRVPGNFHVTSHSTHHSVNSEQTNLSHVVHSLSFGPPLTAAQQRRLERLDVRHRVTATLEDVEYASPRDHAAHAHYLHVVPTKYVLGGFWRDKFSAFQTTHYHHLLPYPPGTAPEARFAYDISPMAVVVERVSRTWYDLLTSLLALVGGAFATFKMATDVSHGVSRRRRR